MKSTGIRRKVDDLGRVVIPAGIRRSLSIREGDEVEVHVEGDQVILAKPVDACVFCQSEEDLQPYRSKVVCRSCVASVGVLDENLRQQRLQPAPHVQAVPDPGQQRPETLPPWDDASRPRPPLHPAPIEPRQVPAAPPDPEQPRPAPAPAPAPAPEPEPHLPPAAAAPQVRDDRDDRYEDPPASTAW